MLCQGTWGDIYLQASTTDHCLSKVASLEETVETLVLAVTKLEMSICHCRNHLLLPGLHYAAGEEVVVDSEEEDDEEEDGLKYEIEIETSDPSYMTPPSTGGHSKPSPCPLCSLMPVDSDPENNVALQTLMIEAHVEVFLAEVDEDLVLHDLPPLEKVTPVPVPAPTIPGFVPFAVSTSQQCVLSKRLPHAYHPYKNSIGQCCCEAGRWCNELPCSSQK